MKRIFEISVLCAAALLVAACGGNSKKAKQAAAQQAQLDSAALAEKEANIEKQLENMSAEPIFDIVTTLGTIRVKLYSNTPMHRDNFAKLALGGFYDGILFHRVINGFMIQGGDPLTKDEGNAPMFGTGGPGYNVPAEILPENRHKLGALAAARRGDAANPKRESSGSQFYIVQNERNCAQLDGQYTVYGETIEGFEVINAIAQVETDYRDCPVTPVKIVTVKFAE